MMMEEEDDAAKDGSQDKGSKRQELCPSVVLPELPATHFDLLFLGLV